MLTRPAGLTDEHLVAVLRAGWAIRPASAEYRPLGFGSHHWQVIADDGTPWFVTADDLVTRLRTATDTCDAAYHRLQAALRTARALADTGATFVVAPVRTATGEVLIRVGPNFALAAYPFIAGHAGEWGDTLTPADRRVVLHMLARVHAAPQEVRDGAARDDFVLAGADQLRNALGDLAGARDSGPYADPARRLLTRHAHDLEVRLARRDRLADEARARPGRLVLTHGEPHPGNIIRAGRRRMLVDWDTVLVAPPERDLWLADPQDGSIAASYRELTGREVLPSALDLYRQTWVLADIVAGVARFRREHTGTEDDQFEWQVLVASLG